MSAWTTQTEAKSQLRILINDTDQDRYRAKKKVFGKVDGVNVTYQTFEFRRVTNLTAPPAGLGVFVSDAPVAVATDDPVTGVFTLSAAPSAPSVVTASYYSHWFFDTELDSFLNSAANVLEVATDYANIPAYLQHAALQYAASESYQKLAVRWAEHLSETYRLEDVPADRFKQAIDAWLRLADAYKKKALELRDDYYTRKGKSLAPRSSIVAGVIRDQVPRR